MAEKPLCFVLMPFGNKKDPGGGPDIGFDAIYDQAIRPAIEGAGMEPVRADEERTGGIIHKPMYERLLLCDYAVADLTTANPNVYYELGIRHAARPATTLAIFARQQMLPFDVNFLRALPYELGDGNRFSAREADLLRSALQNRLRELRDYALEEGATDSPLFQLLSDYRPPDIARLKTDVFREQVQYSMRLKRELAKARSREDSAEVSRIEESLGSHLDGVEAGVLVDLLLSYRALEQWNKMVDLYDRLPATLKRSVMVREQFAFALNRLKERRQALEVLEEVVAERGPSSETMGLIGRVYKDLWAETYRKGNAIAARGYLDKAIDAYVRGFEADWRDAYPGINAITLLEIRGDEGSLARKAELLPVVRFSVNQRLKSAKPDYWDHATLVEIAVLEGNAQAAGQHLSDAIASIREPWEPKTTANNLSLIREARHDRGIEEGWVNDIVTALENENAHRIKR